MFLTSRSKFTEIFMAVNIIFKYTLNLRRNPLFRVKLLLTTASL
jgi:hypothetical protein